MLLYKVGQSGRFVEAQGGHGGHSFDKQRPMQSPSVDKCTMSSRLVIFVSEKEEKTVVDSFLNGARQGARDRSNI